MEQYDYVIVGAGSSGCVLADRLSRDPSVSVLLVEAGGSDRSPVFHIPKGFAFALESPTWSWDYPTEPFGLDGHTEKWSRGRVLGGSSSINGMVWNRGNAADWDGLAELAGSHWSWSEILPIFRSIEDHQLGASEQRGTGGPIHVSVQQSADPVNQALVASAEAIGLKRVDDTNATDEERVGFAPGNIKKGIRQSAAKGFLRPALSRPNLTLRTGTTARRVVFEGDRVVGVAAVGKGGAVEFRARREVILSLGGIATPQLLELSGIGDPEVLKAAGVEVRVASPRVGEGVHEHHWFPLQVRLNRNGAGFNRTLHSPARQALAGVKYLASRSGPLATPAYDVLAFLRSSDRAQRVDAQLLLTPFSLGHSPVDLGVEERPGLSIIGYPLRPTSEGSIHIRSADPDAPPRIVANYCATAHDRKIVVGMFARMREIVAQGPLADVIQAETMPGVAVRSDEDVIESGLVNGNTGYHASGSVAMGTGEDSPLDEHLRVRGVQGLRVMDASVIPTMVAGNLNAPMMAMAWRAADLILDAG